MSKIRIASDGTAAGTKVFQGEKEIVGISRLEILEITPDSQVQARITLNVSSLELQIEDGKAHFQVGEQRLYATMKHKPIYK